MKIFVSSTYSDLADHRAAVNEILLRMKAQLSAMEYFGSHGDTASAICYDEISKCDILIGIYAWRYGWRPTPSEPSITEQEFDYARSKGKTCLCYVIDDNFPWLPGLIDHGKAASCLASFKNKVASLVCSRFTNPDNLAKQVAADLAKIVSNVSPESFGGLLRVNWDTFAPELQSVLSTAYANSRIDSTTGIVSTRHVIAALAALPNSGQPIVTAFPRVSLPTLKPGIEPAEVAEMYFYDRPFSSCVLGSMKRLLREHSATQQLLAIELAVDILKNGHGESVAKFREAGVDGEAVAEVERHIRRVAADPAVLQRGLRELSDAEVIHLAYITRLPVPSGLTGASLQDYVLLNIKQQGFALHLAGELLRRYPRLIEFS